MVLEHFKVGDLLFFRSDTGSYNPQYPNGVGHVMMYIGNKNIIGACGTFPYKIRRVDEVTIISLKKAFKRDDYRGARRIIGYV